MEGLFKCNPIESDLRRAQLRMLDILLEVSKICDKNNISYWLSRGTLLGAVRHKGFIPWDDDVDIEVLQKDYKKLLKHLELELPLNMLLQCNKNDTNYFLTYAKVRDRMSIMHEESSIDFKERGIFIDIFPRKYSTITLENLSRKILGNSLVELKSSKFKNKRKSIYQRSFLNSRVFLYNCSTLSIKILSWILPFENLYTESSNIGIHKAYIFPLRKISFEEYMFNCPSDSDTFLKIKYGDYMKIPLVENRIQNATKIEIFNTKLKKN